MAQTTPADGTPRTRIRHRAGTAALALLAAVTTTGCGGPDGEGRAPWPYLAQSSPDRPPTGRTAPARTQAPDGHDAGACADGNCEIAVSAPVDIRFEGPSGSVTLSVTEVGPDRIRYTVTSGNGRSSVGADGPGQGCVTVLRGDGSGTSCGPAAARTPRAGAGTVLVRATTGRDGTALLRIAPG